MEGQLGTPGDPCRDARIGDQAEEVLRSQTWYLGTMVPIFEIFPGKGFSSDTTGLATYVCSCKLSNVLLGGFNFENVEAFTFLGFQALKKCLMSMRMTLRILCSLHSCHFMAALHMREEVTTVLVVFCLNIPMTTSTHTDIHSMDSCPASLGLLQH